MAIFSICYSLKAKILPKAFNLVQKLCFCKRDGRTRVAWKIFLLGTIVMYDMLLASVGLYLSAEANSMIVRRMKRILWYQTSANGDFFNLVLFESQNPSKSIQSGSKVMFLQTWWSNSSGLKIFFVGYHGHVWHVVGFSRIISIRRSKRHDRTTYETDPMVPNVSWWRFFQPGTLWKPKSFQTHSIWSKSYVFANVMVELEWREKLFCWLPWSCMTCRWLQ